MATISLYLSSQTELGDVTEFFQKKLIGQGETPLAFFDGVFYESHQERVGNIAFQDYLIYSDRAVYLWARGAAKDYLDRFDLGTVAVNSRNKDGDFATINLQIRREGKEPIFVIFDMVEIQEAQLIDRMHTVMESIVEQTLGSNSRQPIPDELAPELLHAARSVCTPRAINLPLESEPTAAIDSNIGYGQDLLEQYKASIGYSQPEGAQMPPKQQQRPAGSPGQGSGMPPGMPPGMPDPMKGLENMLPTDPASLKRIASSIKGMVGEAPFKLRDQVMKDLQHVPGDVATVLTAVNELLSNIAGNPHAERFVMTAIQTAVRNDGVLGSLTKALKMTSSFGGPKKSQAPGQKRSAAGQAEGGFPDEGDETTIRRKKISVKDDAGLPDEGFPLPDLDAPPAGRKKIRIQPDQEAPSSLVQEMLKMDDPVVAPAEPAPAAGPALRQADADDDAPVKRRKIAIVADEPEPAGPATPAADEGSAVAEASGTKDAAPVGRKKIAIVADEPDAPEISEAMLAEAFGKDDAGEGGVYSILESDPVGRQKPAPDKASKEADNDVNSEAGSDLGEDTGKPANKANSPQ